MILGTDHRNQGKEKRSEKTIISKTKRIIRLKCFLFRKTRARNIGIEEKNSITVER